MWLQGSKRTGGRERNSAGRASRTAMSLSQNVLESELSTEATD